MFKLLALKVINHPQLGNLELFFVDEKESKNKKKPYTSVIIGPNGTGKSFILRTIADIFIQLNNYKQSGEKQFNLPYGIHLRYRFDNSIYEVVSSNLIIYNKRGERRSFHFLKNRPKTSMIFSDNKIEFTPNRDYEISIKELELPARLIVNSVMLNDRFVYYDSQPTDFYQYLGARSSNSSASTRSFTRRTIAHLFSATADNNFAQNLQALLLFLGFKSLFKVHYKTKINALFFSGELDENNFRKYFEHWWDPKFEYSNRSKDNPLWSIPYYNNHFKQNEKLLRSIVRFLNNLAKDESKVLHKKRSKSKIIEVDLFSDSFTENDLQMIRHLENLDIINLDGIKIQKDDSSMSVDEISSGEYHLLVSLIGMFAKIEENSLILIDEPEISLHPNWQMRYCTFLKKVFREYRTCHFILTTHSHFLVSDLEGDSSSVLALGRDEEKNLSAQLLEGTDTFGWSPEETLYNVFNVRTVRNHFLEADLTDLLGLISEQSKDSKQIKTLLKSIKSLKPTPNDPLLAVIEETEAYLKQFDK